MAGIEKHRRAESAVELCVIRSRHNVVRTRVSELCGHVQGEDTPDGVHGSYVRNANDLPGEQDLGLEGFLAG